MTNSVTILGLSAYHHDSAACLLRDGEIVAAAQEERFTRRKHDASFPVHAVCYCLREGAVRAEELTLAAFYEKPLRRLERVLQTALAIAPRGLGEYYRSMRQGLRRRVNEDLERELGAAVDVRYCEHHQSHAAAAFYPSPFREAAILTCDAAGEWATTSWGIGRGNGIELRAEIDFPHSLGLLYSAFTSYCGFRVNSGEYKLMGLAPYGEPKYVDVIREHLIDVAADGSYRLNLDYFDYLAGDRLTNEKFARLLGGPPREPESAIEQRHMDLARSIQTVVEDVRLATARHIHAETGMRNLCLGGGVALNCVANGRILREGPFENLFVQPAADDAGSALGAACYMWYRYLDRPRAPGARDAMRGALLGPAFGDDDIRHELDVQALPYHVLDWEEVPGRTAKLIAEQNVVGWFQGRMEFGPRALGARSILADARNPEMQAILNEKIKLREPFRPFAPSVLREDAAAYFELDVESPYMLLTAAVREERRKPVAEAELSGLEKLQAIRSDIPAVTHVDYSGRVQTVAREDNPLYYAMIAAFKDLTGCAVIVNTSFNVRGEPIVCTPADAVRCFLQTDMDYLVIGRYVLDKKAMPARPMEKSEYPPD